MVTYKATSTKTGRFYIGSAKSYNHYMNRKGNHHVRKSTSSLHIDLQADPRSFEWEILREDNLDTRDYEYELLQIYVGQPLCYNKSQTNGAVRGVAQRGRGWEHSDDTKCKMRESALKPEANPPHKKAAQSKAVSDTNSKKQPCPTCGKLMNVGNLTQHIRRGKCSQHVG
jgi:hypothetical protein